MKKILVYAMGIMMMIMPVNELNDYVMEQSQVTYEDLEIRDLTDEELQAIDTIKELMDELFDGTWKVIE